LGIVSSHSKPLTQNTVCIMSRRSLSTEISVSALDYLRSVTHYDCIEKKVRRL